uniref:Uncharacterized protein n=1 Tax=Knipowitschia caucasica TaxID=637954 RepID=A0AAV2K7K4_KNICA
MAPLIALLLIWNCAADVLQGYVIQHRCWSPVCFQTWGPDMAIDCERYTSFITTYPKQNNSLQCVLWRSLSRNNCFLSSNGLLGTTWVDENGDPIKDGEEYGIMQNSLCDVSLRVSFQSPKNKSFRCVAGVNGRTRTSSTIYVTVLPPKGRGRGVVIQQPQPGEGGSEDQAWTSVVAPTLGVVCGVLLVAAAVFALNKRRHPRATTQPDTSAANCALDSEHVMDSMDSKQVLESALDSDPEDVVYADVVLPEAPDRSCVWEHERTVYACVR